MLLCEKLLHQEQVHNVEQEQNYILIAKQHIFDEIQAFVVYELRTQNFQHSQIIEQKYLGIVYRQMEGEVQVVLLQELIQMKK